MPLRIEVHKSIAGIEQTWDRLAPRDRVALESRHLLAIERSGVNAIDPYYLLFYDGSRLVGIIHGFVMRLDVASLDKSMPPEALAALRAWTPDFLAKPIFECGIVSGLGSTIAANAADLDEVCEAGARELTRLAREAGAEFVLVRDIPYARLQDHAAFLREGYAPLLGFPIATMTSRWPSFDAYLEAMKASARRDVRRALAGQPKDVTVELLPDFAAHAERLAELWLRTSHHAADYSHEELNPEYFREIQRCLPDRSRVFALWRAGEIVGFVLSLLGDEEYFAAHCGFEQTHVTGENLYDVLTLTVVKDAISHGARSLNWGITTYDPKFKRGFEADPVVYFVRHARDPHLTVALARGLQKSIHQPENSHRPFRDQDASVRPNLSTLSSRLPITGTLPATDVFSKAYGYDRTDAMKVAGIYSFFPPFESAQGPVISYLGREIVMLGSNAYLGLGTHPDVVAAAKSAIEEYGTGCSGSPILNGTLDIHLDLTRALAQFMQKEDAILFSTGYQTNVGVVSALVGRDDVVIMDRLDHASLVDGARMSGAKIVRFRHNDMESLEHALASHEGHAMLVAVDSVFSMEGTLADLPTVVKLARQYGARTMVDEAHALGVLGPGGRGGAEHFGVLDQVDVVMGTFSKSFASVGGFVAAERKVIDYFRHVARSHVFSASLPPASVAAARASLDIIQNEPERRQRLLRSVEYTSRKLQSLGYDAPFNSTPIVPVHCGSDVLTLGAFKRLFESGVFVNPVLEPAVPKGRELLRTSFMATHTEAMLDRALDIFANVRTSAFPRRPTASVPKLERKAASPRLFRVRPLVQLRLADRHSLAHHYVAAAAGGTLRVPGFTRLEVGAPVDCGIAIAKEQVLLQSQGTVASRTCGRRCEDGPAGIDVELLASEWRTREMIQELLSGKDTAPSRRRHWRYHAEMEAEYSCSGVDVVGEIEDIGLEGAAIRSQHLLDCGARLPLRLVPPDGPPIDVLGEVRWLRQGDAAAFGVQFRFATSPERSQVRGLIDDIEDHMARLSA